ncbi:MAG: Lrp/AsnC family transcriptional regulator [Alphaproteobacteria bacterium]|nr:Lrp/AsnC family transcriptional regulator [Alphaproteobacteria bacterium]
MSTLQIALDRTDREILRLLQEDAERPYKQIADEVGLAASTVYDRVRRLRREGVLGGSHAVISPKAVGVNLQAMLLIELTLHQAATYDAFRLHLQALPEVVAWFEVAGRIDLFVHVCAHDTAHLQHLVMQAFTARPEVRRVETTLIFDSTRKPVVPDLLAP